MSEEQKAIIPVPVLPLVRPEKADVQLGLFEALKAKFSDSLIKELQTAAKWTFGKASEKVYVISIVDVRSQEKCVDCDAFCGRCTKGTFTLALNEACAKFAPRPKTKKIEVALAR